MVLDTDTHLHSHSLSDLGVWTKEKTALGTVGKEKTNTASNTRSDRSLLPINIVVLLGSSRPLELFYKVHCTFHTTLNRMEDAY